MQVLNIVLSVLFVIVDLALIVLVLAQQGRSAGLSGAIAGGAEAVFGKRKARSMDALLARLTRIFAVAFFVLALAMLIIQQFANTGAA